MLKKNGLLDKVKYSEVQVGDITPHYIAFSMKKENEDLSQKFSLALKNFKKTKRYLEILKNLELNDY